MLLGCVVPIVAQSSCCQSRWRASPATRLTYVQTMLGAAGRTYTATSDNNLIQFVTDLCFVSATGVCARVFVLGWRRPNTCRMRVPRTLYVTIVAPHLHSHTLFISYF